MTDHPNWKLLIEPAELHGKLDHVQVLDTRPAEQFAAERIPGAIHLELWGLSVNDTDPGPLHAFLWTISHYVTTRGIDPARPVVLYEESASGIRVARAFWFLERGNILSDEEILGHFYEMEEVQEFEEGNAWVKFSATAHVGAKVAEDVKPPRHREPLVQAGKVLNAKMAERLAEAGVDRIAVRAESLVGRRTGSRIVTNSSAAVGWMPIVASNTALVAPAFIATAKPCTTSPASGPTMCSPTTRSLAVSTTSFMRVRSALPLRVCFSALNSLRNTVMAPKALRACSSVWPTVPMLGCVKTAVGMKS